MRIQGALAVGILFLGLAACAEENPIGPGGSCTPMSLVQPGGGSTLLPSLQLVGVNAALNVGQGTTLGADMLTRCLNLNEDSATYIVVPHFATRSGPSSSVSYELRAGAAGAQAAVRPAASVNGALKLGERPVTIQRRFDAALRTSEQQLAPLAARAAARPGVTANVVPSAAVAAPSLGSTRQFKVLASLEPGGNSKFDDVTATLRFAGTNILIYVDQAAPAAPKGFSDLQLAAFGKLFDQDLYGIDVAAFGNPSDIDLNGRVIVLLTPTVNKLTPTTDCTTGYVAGFFYGLDLVVPAQPNSNNAEIFYSLVPDPDGAFGCAHSVDQVESTTPATFVHEFQHMISWNQHVLVRKAKDEDLWLNEALSHIAEELAARHYEDKYPAPQGRKDPRQIFPDSASGFINGVLFDSYSYLLDPWSWSITKFIKGGNVQERGGAWLFLRWLGDQKGNDVYKKLVQTNLTGIANVEAQSGEKFPMLFGDFTLSLYTDSLPGLPRSSVPPRYRFASRNLRMLYNALYNVTPDSRDQVPRRFPLVTKEITAPGAQSAGMVPGTADFVRVQMPKSAGSQTLRFSQPGGGTFDALLGAQATVFRCPSATACPAAIAP